jgi:hypothetical protein
MAHFAETEVKLLDEDKHDARSKDQLRKMTCVSRVNHEIYVLYNEP